MASREFRDERGRTWLVCDVIPERRDRRSGADRRKTPRPTFDRRKAQLLGAYIGGDFAKGWLVFITGRERRRYAPLPARWTEATDSQLLDWCAEARPLPPAKRLIE
jgi:hypothetical protein